MLQLYYRWRYRRAQRAAAFKLPTPERESRATRDHFGSYLSQQAVRGKVSSPQDQSRSRKRWFGRFAFLIILLILGWIVYESLQAIETWNQ